jgi:hypothetical protein
MDKYNFTKYVKDVVYINKKISYANIVNKEKYTYVVTFLPCDNYCYSSEITNKFNRAMSELYKRILLSSEKCDIKLAQLVYDDPPLIYNDITYEIMKIQYRSFDEHEIPGTIIKTLQNLNNTINSIKDSNVTCIIVGCGHYLMNYTLPTNIDLGIYIDVDDAYICPTYELHFANKYCVVKDIKKIPINVGNINLLNICSYDEIDDKNGIYEDADSIPLSKLNWYLYLLINMKPNNVIYESIAKHVNEYKNVFPDKISVLDLLECCLIEYEFNNIINKPIDNDIYDKLRIFTKSTNSEFIVRDRYDKIRLKNMIGHIKDIDGELTEREDRLIDEAYEIINERNVYESLEQNITKLTYSNWFDEIEQDGAMGLLLTIYNGYHNNTGLDLNSGVHDVTSTYISIPDYIDLLNGRGRSMLVIDDICIGSGNLVIPLYINKYHWVYGRKYLDNILALGISGNPFNYTKSSLRSLFKIFFIMTTECFQQTRTLDDTWLVSYIQLWRTCVEIMSELKYNRGIMNFINDIVNKPDKMLFKTEGEQYQIFGQILTSGVSINNKTMKDFILFMLAEMNRYRIYHKQGCKKITVEDVFKKDNINKIIKFMSKNMSHDPLLITEGYNVSYFLVTYEIFHKLYSKYGGFNKTIKHIDNKYGFIDDDMIQFFKKEMLGAKYREYNTKSDFFVSDSFNDQSCVDIFDRLNIKGTKGFTILNSIHSLIYNTRKDKAKAIIDKSYYKGHDKNYEYNCDNIISHYREQYKNKDDN